VRIAQAEQGTPIRRSPLSHGGQAPEKKIGRDGAARNLKDLVSCLSQMVTTIRVAPAAVFFKAALPRLTLRITPFADFLQMKGFGLLGIGVGVWRGMLSLM
jgi:hypothetical protein